MSKEHIIRSSFDLDNPPKLTPAQLEKLRKLSELPDSEIDYSDIPPLDLSKMKPVPMDERHMFRKQKKKILVP